MSDPHDLTQEFLDRKDNGEVGNTLVSETERVRVWHIHAKPGERLKVHTHVLDYFWTIHAPGKARNHLADGTYVDVEYATGDTKHFTFEKGEKMTHSLENIGETDLIFTTVEFKNSANAPLSLSDSTS
jgi:mannose-6-phosphate isomerase-like protein (cupin superfamily)